jgi:4-hydroxy-3-methylbut-2-enyl diphosphate reductase
MEILLAENLGFCMGVKRVVDMAYRAQSKAGALPVVTLGPLIHNKQETDRLAHDGIQMAHDPAQLDSISDGFVIIRAHGVTPQVYDSLRQRGLKVMDGTCPYVHYSQRKAVELHNEGYEVVIVGDKNHPEIIGILGHLDGQAHVVKTVEEAQHLAVSGRVGTIAQTTISPQKYQEIIEVLRARAREVKVCETICDATEENQAAVRRLAAEVDRLYVIGGRHSANSNKLVEQAKKYCENSLLIETADEIQADDLRGVQRVGISAGASTPDWLIEVVVRRLHEIDRQFSGQ